MFGDINTTSVRSKTLFRVQTYPRALNLIRNGRPPPSPPQIEEARGTSALPAPEEAAAAAAAAAATTRTAAVPATPKFDAVPIGKWEPVASDTQRENGRGGGGGGVAEAAAAATEAGSSGAGVFGVGARVEVLSGDKWYPAVSGVEWSGVCLVVGRYGKGAGEGGASIP